MSSRYLTTARSVLPRDGHRRLVDRRPPPVANSRFAAAVEGGEDYVPAKVRQQRNRERRGALQRQRLRGAARGQTLHHLSAKLNTDCWRCNSRRWQAFEAMLLSVTECPSAF